MSFFLRVLYTIFFCKIYFNEFRTCHILNIKRKLGMWYHTMCLVLHVHDRKLKNSEFLYIFTMNDTSTYVLYLYIEGKTNQSN
jgi:hypothetical protein